MNHKNKKQEFKTTLGDIERIMPFFTSVDNTTQLEKTFTDEFITAEQKKRDKEITKLLTYYVLAYNEKRKSNPKYKKIILYLCCGIILVFSSLFIYLLIIVSKTMSSIAVNNVVALVTVCISYLTLVIGILKIITKYVFPQQEEEYITRIVEDIQKNDLKNKKTNIRISSKNEDN